MQRHDEIEKDVMLQYFAARIIIIFLSWRLKRVNDKPSVKNQALVIEIFFSQSAPICLIPPTEMDANVPSGSHYKSHESKPRNAMRVRGHFDVHFSRQEGAVRRQNGLAP